MVTLTEIKPETKLLMEPELREGSLLIPETTSVIGCRFFCHILDFSTFFFNVTLSAGLSVTMAGREVFGSW